MRNLDPPEARTERGHAEQHQETDKLNSQKWGKTPSIHSKLLSDKYGKRVTRATQLSIQKMTGAISIAIKPGPPICHQTSFVKKNVPRRKVIIRYCAKMIAEV